MADLLPCPTCQATLRFPAGAAAIRCPNCKTVVEVPAAPPRPKPAAAKPVGAGAPKYVTAEVDPEKKKQMERELRKLAREEEREAERYEVLKEHCRSGRLALTLLMWGVRAYGLGTILAIGGIVAATVADAGSGSAFGYVTLLFGGLSTALILTGFGYALIGPEAARHLAIMGIVLALMQSGFVAAEYLTASARVRQLDNKIDDRDKYSWVDTLPYRELFGPATNFSILSEHPSRFLRQYPYSALAIAAAAMEFARLVILCMLTQTYAAGGKASELGHTAMGQVNKIFWVLLLAAMFRVSFTFGFDWMPPEDLLAKIGLAAHGALTVFSMLAIAVFLGKLSTIMQDTIEVVEARRYMDVHAKLED